MTNFQWVVMEANLNPVVGAGKRGIRPVLIVSNEEYNQAISNVTILLLTSTQRRLYPSEVYLPKGKAGQPLDSIIMAHQVRTISKQRLRRLLGYLGDTQLRYEMHGAIREHLELE